MITLAELNLADESGFVAVCGPLFEHSPWIAQRSWKLRPFTSLKQLHTAMCNTVTNATPDEKLALIRSHPDLVGRLAREGRLTAQSTTEQAAAGLSQLSSTEAEAFDHFNTAYREQFGFPFVICARENRKEAILAAFPVRLKNEIDSEIATALSEIYKIAWLRLTDAVSPGEKNMTFKLTSNQYGKSDVRLTKVIRRGDRHDLLEFAVNIALTGDFARSYTHGDNKQIVATDSMKNTVYVLAKENEFTTAEEFAVLLAKHFPKTYPQVAATTVAIEQTSWQRIAVDGKPHDHAFVSGGNELHTVSATVSAKGAAATVTGGVTNLLVLKTTRSVFKDFVTDRYRTLKDADDRIFATSVIASWDYSSTRVDFAAIHQKIRDVLLTVFATHMSYAVQETMYEMGKAALAAVPEIDRVHLRLPNKHRIPVNLQPFRLENKNEIFVWTDEPFGDISATVERGDR